MVYLYFAVAFYVVVYSLSLVMALLVRVSDAFRSRRRGGDPRQPASSATSRVVTYTTNGTPLSVVYSNSRGELGPESVAKVIQHMQLVESNAIALGSYGSAAGVGDSPGQRQGLAG